VGDVGEGGGDEEVVSSCPCACLCVPGTVGRFGRLLGGSVSLLVGHGV